MYIQRVLAVTLLLLIQLGSGRAQNGWQSIANVHSLYQPFFQSPDTGYAIFGDPCLETRDGGVSWHASPIPYDWQAPDDPSQGDHLTFAITDGWMSINRRLGDTILRSTDGGQTWQRVFFHGITGINGSQIVADTILLVASDNELFISKDSAKSFQPMVQTRTSTRIFSFRFADPLNGLMVVRNADTLATDAGFDSVFSTTDAGVSWAFGGLVGWGNLGYVSWHRTMHRWVITGADPTFYFSDDNSHSWRSVPVFKRVMGIIPWRYSFFGDSIGYMITVQAQIYKTTDGGTTWFEQKVMDGRYVNDYTVRSTDITAVSDSVAYASIDSLVLKTVDGGGPPLARVNDNPDVAIFLLIGNPVHDVARLSFSERVVAERLEVFDDLGRRIDNRTIPVGATYYALDVHSIPVGIYSVRLGTQTLRFVKL